MTDRIDHQEVSVTITLAQLTTSPLCQMSAQVCEMSLGGPALTKQKKIVHFSSGETLELEDSEEEEEEEQTSSTSPFREPAEKTKLSFRNVAVLVGRISLLTCDFLGERLAGALGLNEAKYQYAIDQYQRECKTTGDHAEVMHLSSGPSGNHYGAAGDINCPSEPQQSCHSMDTDGGRHNRGYQADEDNS